MADAYKPVRGTGPGKLEPEVLEPVEPLNVETQPFEPMAEAEVTAQNIETAEKEKQAEKRKANTRKLTVPEYRVGRLRKNWADLCKPIKEELNLAIKFVPKLRQVLLLPAWCLDTEAGTPSAAQQRQLETHMTKAMEFIKAILVGFSVADALAVLRLEDIFQQSFQITEVKRLDGANLGRAIGRIAGKDGRTRDALQHSTRTRIILEDKTVHLLGGSDNITLARDAIGSLILGSPPNKVHAHLSVVSRRMKERA